MSMEDYLQTDAQLTQLINIEDPRRMNEDIMRRNMEEEPDPRNVNAPYRHPDNIRYEVDQQRIANVAAERDIQIKRDNIMRETRETREAMEASKTPEQREKERLKALKTKKKALGRLGGKSKRKKSKRKKSKRIHLE